jgi:threonylcarbamoyladenosine tRNA methylthiotransferase MtaB
MPQVPGAAIKARATRLREAGDAARSRHLDALAGTEQVLLTEGPRLGRTESFAEVTFDTDQPEGSLIRLRLAGHDGQRLRA